MKKIIIIGSPGAGKSTFARKLSEITNLPLFYLDMLWHKEDKTNVSKEEFDNGLLEIVNNAKWIIDGNYGRTLDKRFCECDTVFLLDFPVDICLEGAANRIGEVREDMPWVETEWDEEFRQFITDFPKNELPEIYKHIHKYEDTKNVVVFKSRVEINNYLTELKNEQEMNLIEALRQINSTIRKLEESLKTLNSKENSRNYISQITLAERRITAFSIAVDLIEEELRRLKEK